MNIILKLIDRIMSVINQLPGKEKVRQSPVLKSSPPKARTKKVKVSPKPQARKGRRGSETQIYNHPRD